MTAILEQRSAAFGADRSLRYNLDLRWDDERPPIVWIMQNPSTADENRDDPTIRRVKRFSACWGFGAAHIYNLFPYRSPSPEACRSWYDQGDSLVRQPMENNRRRAVAAARDAGVVCIAWGAAPWMEEEATQMLHALAGWNGSPAIVCLGRTQSGAPIHPLARGARRVPDDRTPELYLPAAAVS